MVVSANTETYNKVFTENYKQLLKFCNNEEDRLHNIYLDVRERLTKIVFTAQTATALETQLIIYTKTGLWNDWKEKERLKKKNIEPEECLNELEYKLQLQDGNEINELERQAELREWSKRLFDYIKKNYPQEWEYVFVTYYLYDSHNKKITYENLSKICGYSISKCCNIIQTIKKDLNKNFNCYGNG